MSELKHRLARLGFRQVVKRLGWALLTAAALGSTPLQAFSPLPSAVAPTIERHQLPPQGREVLEQIETGGPFRYDKDGSVFGNRERLLPSEKRGYYREYTVPTPGLSHRGARRIVCGGTRPSRPEACYYTQDHYASFRLIAR